MKKKSTRLVIIILVALLLASTVAAAVVQLVVNAPLKAEKYVTLGQYKGIEIEKVVPKEVTDEDVQARIDSALAAHATEQEVTDRPAKEGDILSIDYVGTMNGEQFEGGTAEDQRCVIGSGSYIDGFEEGLIGVSMGEHTVLELTFPEVYKNNEALAGKPVTFVVTVNSIKEEILPEYNDAFIAEHYDYSTTAEYEAAVREELAVTNAEAANEERLTAAWNAAIANATFNSYPQRELDMYTNNTVTSYTYVAENYYGMDLETFLSNLYGMTVEEFTAQAKDDAKLMVEDLLVVKAIANAENIEVTDEEYEAGKLTYLVNMGYSSEVEFQNAFGKSFDEYYGEDYLTDSLLAVKVQGFVANNAVEVE
ncbi:MAG: trigger factor [Clostridia bacterium]|nr:trigger factor [Clostridia bacterium]